MVFLLLKTSNFKQTPLLVGLREPWITVLRVANSNALPGSSVSVVHFARQRRTTSASTGVVHVERRSQVTRRAALPAEVVDIFTMLLANSFKR